MRYITFTNQANLIKSKLQAFDPQISALRDVETLSELQIAKVKTIKASVIKKNSEFDALANKLFNTDPLPPEVKFSEVSQLQDEISELYVKILSACEILIPESVNTEANTSGTVAASSEFGIRLPTLNLGKFSGQADKWISFHSLYETSVHQNNNITDTEKFIYLLSCLDGEPLSLIKSLPVTAANYHIAWKNLTQRYHNSRLLISLHVNNILDLPSNPQCTVRQLRNFISTYQENASALNALGHKIQSESLFLTSHILRKFDHEFIFKFEHSRENSQEVPNIDEFITFIEKECVQLEAADLTLTPSKLRYNTPKGNIHTVHKQTRTPQTTVKTALFTSSTIYTCVFCSSLDHYIYKCEKFAQLSPEERLKFIKNNSLCNNCLHNHNVRNCKSKRNCNTCNRRHHTLLHLYSGPTCSSGQTRNGTKQVKNPTQSFVKDNVNFKANMKDSQSDKTFPTSALVGLSHARDISILLATALVQISNNGYSIVARAVLDSAAQHSFMTESCARNLNVQYSHEQTAKILGISSAVVNTKGLCNVSIGSLSGDILTQNHPFVVLEKITNNLPSQQISQQVRERMRHLVLADPTFDTPAPIDVLIGADLFPYTLLGGSLTFGENMPIALNTIFGYVLIGKCPLLKTISNESVNLLTISNFDLHSAIQQFWTMENPPQETSSLTPAEEECELHFKKTHLRDSTGKYICRLPFKETPEQLGNTSNLAKCAFYSLERKFSTQPELKEKYLEFMSDYLSSGHMKPCNKIPNSSQPHYFVPHHGVFKDGKIRVVFNASVASSTGLSLNSILHQGPKLHNDISNIILRFRQHKIAFGCDIRQMFRMILIHEKDHKYQLIYWRDNPSDTLQVFQLTTVTYGMSSSPYIANRVIQQLIEDEGHNHPCAAAALRDGIYVDDILVGSDSIDDALRLQEDITNLMSKGGFSLRKWTSNHHSILEAVPDDHRGTPLQLQNPDQLLCSILGLKWLPEADGFSYLVTTIKKPFTKRSVLSAIAHIYDPMGWIAPVVFYAKSFIQLLWTKGVDWDDQLPSDLIPQWNKFIKELTLLEQVLIPRHVDTIRTLSIQLHGFCDASEAGFCATVLLRVQYENRDVNTYLLLAKSRVAPLKRVSIPRLELCGAQLASKLLNYCAAQLSTYIKLDQVFGWCDSTIVLSWIKTPAYRLKTYVANRVSEIQCTSTPITWSHVRSDQNPADCGSRGLYPSQLISQSLWWNGPAWLKLSPTHWPPTIFTSSPIESLPDIKTIETTTLHVIKLPQSLDISILSKFSSWTKLIHVIAYILRFIHCCRKKQNPPRIMVTEEGSSHILSLQEIDLATTQVLRLVQKEAFPTAIATLQKNVRLSGPLQRLSPFLDKNGLIRVGGRLSNSSLQYNAKHPILLPKCHFVTELLIDYHHIYYLHCGPQQLQSLISQKYWILSARSAIRSRIFRCIRCYRNKPKLNEPQMADLPSTRVTPTKAFTISAVDFAGPFNVKIHKIRRLQHIKVYLCLFICLSTKAVHLEVVMDLTSEAFVASLTRFISRRGLVSQLYSDNATNFVGAARQIRQALKQIIQQPHAQQFLSEHMISFHFIPPRAPHFGGLWERAIKSAKYHMRRVIGDQILTVEEFITLCCRIEAMLNSRPITPLSSDPGDLDVLTPGHFLIGGPLVSLPELDNTHHSTNHLKRWQLLQAFAQHVWKRWHNEYLHHLQHRPKWTKPQINLKQGDLVLIHDSNVPPLQWKMGRIVKTFPGEDNIVRVAEVRTKSGLITRPAVKLSLLPIE